MIPFAIPTLARNKRVSGGAPGILRPQDVFATTLFSDGRKTITNGLDLAANGGLIWEKQRNSATQHYLFGTSPSSPNSLNSASAGAQVAGSDTYALLSNGYQYTSGGWANGNSVVAWAFRRAAKFFDIVNYTGSGGSGTTSRQIAHSLGVKPGLIILKGLSATTNWVTHHQAMTTDQYLLLNSTAMVAPNASMFGTTAHNETTFSVASNASTNGSGTNYVAYLFAHDPSPDGLIQCGTYAGNGLADGPTVNLGWQPQYLLIKTFSGASGNWIILDTARGLGAGAVDVSLYPNSTSAESGGAFELVDLTSTGFKLSSTTLNAASTTYLYMAIRKPV